MTTILLLPSHQPNKSITATGVVVVVVKQGTQVPAAAGSRNIHL